MFRAKTKRLAHLEHYLEARSVARPASGNTSYVVMAIGLGFPALVMAASHSPTVLTGVMGLGSLAAAYRAFTRRPVPPSPAEEMARVADRVAEVMRAEARRRRLPMILHSGLADTLNECAGFWRRIHEAVAVGEWNSKSLSAHWQEVRSEAQSAADFAMIEALVLVETSLDRRNIRPEEVVLDWVDSNVFGKTAPSSIEPLPPSFKPVRAIADRLRSLANEVERASLHGIGEEVSAPAGARRLDEVLGDLRAIREAETELRQDTRG